MDGAIEMNVADLEQMLAAEELVEAEALDVEPQVYAPWLSSFSELDQIAIREFASLGLDYLY